MDDTIWHIPTHDRIRDRSSDRANRRIDRRTWESVHALESPSAIRARLLELDREWNIDRALMLVASILGGASALLAARRGKLWPGLLGIQLGFLGYHAIARWCPPLPVLRWLGVRSDHEIASERVALEKRLLELTH